MQDKKKKNIKVRDLEPKKNAKGRFQMTGTAKTPTGPAVTAPLEHQQE